MTDLIADFFGRFALGSSRNPDLIEGRILMNRGQLVLVADEDSKVTVPLDSIFDVTVGYVPPKFEGFFDDTVTIAYEADDAKRTVVIEGDGDSIDRFVVVLLKALLNGVETFIRHPARIGGRVTDASPRLAQLRIDRRTVVFETDDEDVQIDLATVTDFDRTIREFEGRERPTLEVHHFSEGQTITTFAITPSARIANILGRHIRLEYNDVRAEVTDITLTEPETEALVALYTAGGDVDIGAVLSGDATEINSVMRSLNEKGLIVDDASGTRLTPEGRVVVAERLEQINA